jgi:antitoxin ParD1/3/4
MNVTLTPELRQLIEHKVQSGMYSNSSEVVREALRMLEERDELAELRKAEIRAAIAEGLEDIAHGRTVPFTKNTLAEVKANGRARLAAERKGRKSA